MSSGGLAPARLARMREIIAGHVERGDVPGVVTLIHRRGDVHVDVAGQKAVGAASSGNGPMQRDTIFRIASMTKPVTAAATMILVEDCRLRLDEPVDPWLPELANRKVLKRVDGPLDDTVPASRPITTRDLLTFTLGIGFAMVPEQSPILRAMNERQVAPSAFLSTAPGNDAWIENLGTLPLMYQPGERWLYHTGSDVLGVLIARVIGRSFGAYLEERIFGPLGMQDTGFSVPSAKLGRLASAYWTNPETGRVEFFDDARDSRWSRPPPFESGGGGLVSTVDDFSKFGEMMLNKGVLRGTRILSRPSVELMATDQLTPAQKSVSGFFPGTFDRRGWGFGVMVVTGRDDVYAVPGNYGWDGGYGTSWWVDPNEGLFGILLTQRLWTSPSPPRVYRDFWTAAYAALDA